MVLLILSAAFVGLVHSLAPGHWVPIVLMAKTRRWSRKTAICAAIVAASGHILLSVVLGGMALEIGVHLLTQYEDHVERSAALLAVLFGLSYAGIAYWRHSQCKGHTHHGPDPRFRRGPYLFLFSLGFSPCIAVFPVFLAAAPSGMLAVVLSMAAFSMGVIFALVGATLLVSQGLTKLDHPLLEHYGDVITGLGVAMMGLILFLY